MTPSRGWFYPGITVVVAVTVLAGFAPTYYLRSQAGAPPLSALTHAHGIAFTAWIGLLLAQVSLVAAGRRDVHRRLGVAGGGLAVAMVALGVLIAFATAHRDIAAGRGDQALSFLIIPLGDILAFAALAGLALYRRAQPAVHKRLMLLATIAILPAAIGRIPVTSDPGPFTLAFAAFLAAAPVHEIATTGRPHPVSLWGGLAVFAWLLGRFLSSETTAWRAVAAWMVG
jgi:uncharacterized membrane protein YozB (DUF420 family)